jgi:DNA replication ATP-dependent helicase Dna2
MLKRIAEKHPESIAQLTYQYRMHEDICQLSNDIIYGGKLKCANDKVRRQQLEMTGFPENLSTQYLMPWMTQVVDPSKAVVFLNTDGIKATCTTENDTPTLERTSGRSKGGNIVNDTEGKLVRVVVESMLSCGLQPSSIGVVCPFRAQVSAKCLLSSKNTGFPSLTLSRFAHSYVCLKIALLFRALRAKAWR